MTSIEMEWCCLKLTPLEGTEDDRDRAKPLSGTEHQSRLDHIFYTMLTV